MRLTSLLRKRSMRPSLHGTAPLQGLPGTAPVSSSFVSAPRASRFSSGHRNSQLKLQTLLSAVGDCSSESITRRTIRFPMPASSAAAPCQNREKYHWRTTACCFSTSYRNSNATTWKSCASPRGRQHHRLPRHGLDQLSGKLHVGCRHEPLPLRL